MALEGVDGPLIILEGGDHELDLIRGPEQREVCPSVAVAFAAGRALEIHDPANPGIDGSDVQGSAGFEQDCEPVVTQSPHQVEGGGLLEGFAAGELDQGQPRCGGWGGPASSCLQHRCADGGHGHAPAPPEGVRGIAIGTAEGTPGQAHEDAGQPGEGAFALQAGVDLGDGQAVRDRPAVTLVTGLRRLELSRPSHVGEALRH